jgi:hypothetical protein
MPESISGRLPGQPGRPVAHTIIAQPDRPLDRHAARRKRAIAKRHHA